VQAHPATGRHHTDVARSRLPISFMPESPWLVPPDVRGPQCRYNRR